MGESVRQTVELLDIQKEQIRLGEEAGLDVSLYANPAYDWFQMEEIRLGLMDRLDVSVYASTDIPYDMMRELRIALKDNLDLSKYKKLNAGVVHELRRAILSGVDLTIYMKQGYVAEQLEQIRIALEKRIPIDKYINTTLRGVAIQEIWRGLEQGFDVQIYATTDYEWRQMKEIRLGMEQRVDYEIYANPLYDWRQMREIRKGLSRDLNVSNYKSLMYPWREMRKRRKRLEAGSGILQDDSAEKQASQQKNSERVSKETNFQVSIKEHNMEAYLTIYSGSLKVAKQEILEVLRINKVTHGILEQVVEDVADGKYDRTTVLIAKGQIPKQGADGWYEYFFRTNVDRSFRLRADGTVDYRDVDWFEMVSEGQKLALYHRAEPGIDGFTVTGQIMKGKKGREMPGMTGYGFVLAPDKITYYAGINGIITLNDMVLNISPEMVLDEVTIITGNVNFNGSVRVLGDVEDGVIIKAQDDVVVNGFVGGATIECGGKLLVKQGINAGFKGSIKAEGGVTSKFFEGATVETKGDIQATDCLNSQIKAGGIITITGSLAGGRTYAEKGIVLNDVGNRAGIGTMLVLGTNFSLMKELSELSKEMIHREEQMLSLQDSLKQLKEKFTPEQRNEMPIYLKVENSIFLLKQELLDGLEQKRKLEFEMAKTISSAIEIKGTAYDGTKADVTGIAWKARGEKNIRIHHGEDNQVVIQGR